MNCHVLLGKKVVFLCLVVFFCKPSVPLLLCTMLVDPNINVKIMCFIQDPAINIAELKDIHSEINLTVPDPILLSNLHDGLEAVRLQLGH